MRPLISAENPNGWRRILLRIAVTALILGIWFWTQTLIGTRPAPASGLGDALHNLTAGWNAYFYRTPAAANALLISSSALIDLMALFLLSRWLFGPSIRPFFGLAVLMALRQVLQSLCSLPAPPNMIWHNPGLPSLLVTYNVANDFFFSGHTAIAVFSAIEIAQLRKMWLTVMAVVVVLFEIGTVIVLRAHYTMDIFTGLLAALWVAQMSAVIAPKIDRIFPRTT
jgi:hypothetical protein